MPLLPRLQSLFLPMFISEVVRSIYSRNHNVAIDSRLLCVEAFISAISVSQNAAALIPNSKEQLTNKQCKRHAQKLKVVCGNRFAYRIFITASPRLIVFLCSDRAKNDHG